MMMVNDKGVVVFLEEYDARGDGGVWVRWTLSYLDHTRQWDVSGSLKTSVKVWKDKGFKVVGSF